MKRIKATAIVTLTLRIPVDDVWGADCAVEQIHRQAVTSARDKLQAPRAFQHELVGEPTVTTVLIETEL